MVLTGKSGSSCQQIRSGHVQGSSFLDWCKCRLNLLEAGVLLPPWFRPFIVDEVPASPEPVHLVVVGRAGKSSESFKHNS